MEKESINKTKKCTKCKCRKELSEFSKAGKLYTRSDCKKCHAKYVKSKYDKKQREKKRTYYKVKKSEIINKYRNNKYKVTPAQFAQMLKNQKDKCKICQQKLMKPCIDHCHVSGKIRGILCSNCNTGLGYFQDNIESLKAAIKYLEDNV